MTEIVYVLLSLLVVVLVVRVTKALIELRRLRRQVRRDREYLERVAVAWGVRFDAQMTDDRLRAKLREHLRSPSKARAGASTEKRP